MYIQKQNALSNTEFFFKQGKPIICRKVFNPLDQKQLLEEECILLERSLPLFS